MATAKSEKKTTKKRKSKTAYVVQWDKDEDPIVIVPDLETAKKLVLALLTNDQDGAEAIVNKTPQAYSILVDTSTVEKGSIKVYKAELISEPKVEIVFK